MHENDLKLIEDSFKKYYFDHFDLIHVPSKPSEREFGYQKFDSGMNRHLLIKDDKELHLMLITNVPSDVYCSNAYYSFPNLPMNEKDWKEADLIFDIDAKDLNLECRQDHCCIKCNSCGETSTLQQTCSKCQSTKFDTKSLTCMNCISAAKQEVKKLLNVLVEDLGVKKENIEIYFSGNEGFHIYAYDTQYQKLGSRERSELSDYIMFHGSIPETFGFKKIKTDRSYFPDFDEKGWRGRISHLLYGSKSKRSKIISEIISDGYSAFQKKLDKMNNSIGAKIDTNVTSDIHRIFRLSGSLNSKSGLTKFLCKDLEKFDPFIDACFIDDSPVDIIVNCPIPFKLKNKKFGPYYNEQVSIPKYAAVYLICKGLGTTAKDLH